MQTRHNGQTEFEVQKDSCNAVTLSAAFGVCRHLTCRSLGSALLSVCPQVVVVCLLFDSTSETALSI